jgi:ubiquitin-like-conjugating enzyme ATG3
MIVLAVFLYHFLVIVIMKNWNVLGHQIGDAYRGVVSMFSQVQSETKFETTGTLTPEEFVKAGDQLVFKFPTWKWAPASDKSLERSYLPKGKQYLVTMGVVCQSRVRELDQVLATSTREDAEYGWLVAGVSEEEISDSQNKAPPSINVGSEAPHVNLSEFADLDTMLLQEGDIDQTTKQLGRHNASQRTYDLSITWDKYYQTPRLWLFGYNEAGQALTDNEVYEDVLSEYVTKTVTVDAHPATGVRTASIHPCQHAKMMLKVINDWKENNHPVRPDLSLFVFLKFISGVVPTINYDFTMDIDM